MLIKDAEKCQECGSLMVPTGFSRKNKEVELFCSRCGNYKTIPFKEVGDNAFGLSDDGSVSFDCINGQVECDFADLPNLFISEAFDENLDPEEEYDFNEREKTIHGMELIASELNEEQQEDVLKHFGILFVDSFEMSLSTDFRDGETMREEPHLEDYVWRIVEYIEDTFGIEVDTSEILDNCEF